MRDCGSRTFVTWQDWLAVALVTLLIAFVGLLCFVGVIDLVVRGLG